MTTDQDRTPSPVDGRPHVVIVGAGFGGLSCAQALGGSTARVTVIDRRNYHLFQPLLYQVATAALSPADIAAPVRHVLARFRNIDTVMDEVTGVDVERRRVLLAEGGHVPYDTLVLATGSAYNYFGRDEWAEAAPGLKTIGNARAIRARLLRAFEEAETTDDPERQRALLTTVVIGGGPTGVEMAGAVAELSRHTLTRDFRRIDPGAARILLVEAGPRLLAAFPEDLGAYAASALRRLGVEVRLGAMVERVDADGVVVGGEPIRAATVIWGAGIRAAEGAAWLGVTPDRLGRLGTNPDLSVSGVEGVYALGDLAAVQQDGQALPALAQVATQQGRHLGKSLARNLKTGEPVRPFRYVTRGDTAVIGRHAAVYSYRRWRMKGPVAWLLWAIVHVYLLITFEQRLLVAVQWVWRYFTYQRGARLID